MTDKKKPESLEFEAKWAPSDDWRAEREASDGKGVPEWYERIAGKFDPALWPKEVEKLPLRQRFGRLPMSALKAAPTAILLVAWYYVVRTGVTMLAGADGNEFDPFIALRLIAFLTFATSLVIGWQIASYPEGRLKPSLRCIAKRLRANWGGVLLACAFIGFVGFQDNDGTASFAGDVVDTLFVVILLFGAWDLKVFHKRK